MFHAFFERHAQHTRILYTQTHAITFFAVCVLFRSVNAVVTNVVRMKSNDTENL